MTLFDIKSHGLRGFANIVFHFSTSSSPVLTYPLFLALFAQVLWHFPPSLPSTNVIFIPPQVPPTFSLSCETD